MVSSQQIEDLTAAGFVVVSLDYSLCPQVSLYNGPFQDARDSYYWCKGNLPSLLATEGVKADATKVVAVGYSAGGTLALSLVGDGPSFLACWIFAIDNNIHRAAKRIRLRR